MSKALVTGVLIDVKCGNKMMDADDPEFKAAQHSLACVKRPSCAESGFAVITKKKMLRFDEPGNKLAKQYLADASSTKVKVEGTENAGVIAVTNIRAADEKK